MNIVMEPGTSVIFKSEDYKAGDYEEVTAEVASRSRYVGVMVWYEPENMCLAVFLDPKTQVRYGQPV